MSPSPRCHQQHPKPNTGHIIYVGKVQHKFVAAFLAIPQIGIKGLLKSIGGLMVNPTRCAKSDDRAVTIFSQVHGAARPSKFESDIKPFSSIARIRAKATGIVKFA